MSRSQDFLRHERLTEETVYQLLESRCVFDLGPMPALTEHVQLSVRNHVEHVP